MFLKELLVHMPSFQDISIFKDGAHAVTLSAGKVMQEGYGDLVVGLMCTEKRGALRIYAGGDFSKYRMAGDDDDLEL